MKEKTKVSKEFLSSIISIYSNLQTSHVEDIISLKGINTIFKHVNGRHLKSVVTLSKMIKDGLLRINYDDEFYFNIEDMDSESVFNSFDKYSLIKYVLSRMGDYSIPIDKLCEGPDSADLYKYLILESATTHEFLKHDSDIWIQRKRTVINTNGDQSGCLSTNNDSDLAEKPASLQWKESLLQ